MSAIRYYESITGVLDRIHMTQAAQLRRAGELLAVAITGAGRAYLFGSGHSVIPVMDVALEKLEFTGNLVDEEIGDTKSKRAEVGAGLTQVLGRWQRVLFVRLSNETTTEFNGDRNTAFYVFPGISYSTLPSYIVGGKVRPYRLYFELRGSNHSLGSGRATPMMPRNSSPDIRGAAIPARTAWCGDVGVEPAGKSSMKNFSRSSRFHCCRSMSGATTAMRLAGSSRSRCRITRPASIVLPRPTSSASR